MSDCPTKTERFYTREDFMNGINQLAPVLIEAGGGYKSRFITYCVHPQQPCPVVIGRGNQSFGVPDKQ